MGQSSDHIPSFLYGTAWKEDKTEALTLQALKNGFRAIDTANQRKHYFEAAVGNAIDCFLKTENIQRANLFIQSKYTFKDGQDHRLPYDPKSPVALQVEQSFLSSLQHLKTDYLDSYILHGPSSRDGLTSVDREAWRAMEKLVHSNKVKRIGLSNINLKQLIIFFEEAEIKPSVVQNRCFAVSAWDKEIREFCKAHNIHYQGFSLLTANIHFLQQPFFQTISQHYQMTIPQIIFKYCHQIGIIPITGTSNLIHMREDLHTPSNDLNDHDLRQIEISGLI